MFETIKQQRAMQSQTSAIQLRAVVVVGASRHGGKPATGAQQCAKIMVECVKSAQYMLRTAEGCLFEPSVAGIQNRKPGEAMVNKLK